MPGIIERRNLAGDRYRAALLELRAAHVDLAALDRLTNSQSFPPAPELVSLRHPTFTPDIAGAMTDGVIEAMEVHRRADARALV